MSDSTCDFSVERARERMVEIVGFHYADASEGQSRLSEEQLTAMGPSGFYGVLRSGARLVTSQPSQLDYEEAFGRAFAADMPTVLICVSSGLSGAYDSALVALKRVRERHPDCKTPIYVADSLCASTPLWLLVDGACDRRDAGWDAERIYRWVLEARSSVRTLFTVEDLEYLHRGGRLPKAVATVGGALHARPLLTFDQGGRLCITGVARGRKKAFGWLADNYAHRRVTSNGVPVVAIGDAGTPEEALLLTRMVEEKCPDAVVLRSTISLAIGVHVGPGMVSCCFWGGVPALD